MVMINPQLKRPQKRLMKNPKFEKLKTPMVKVMAKVATIKMIAERGDFNVDDLVDKIDGFINRNKK